MFDNQGKDIVQCAATLACLLHRGQVDKAGVDYFTGHLTAVAKMGTLGKSRLLAIYTMQVRILRILLSKCLTC